MTKLSVAHQVAFAALVLAGIGRGCGSSTCAAQGDCGPSQVCSFTPGDCSGNGTCQSFTACQTEASQACACDGTTTVDVPCGFPGAPVPAKAGVACPIPSGTPCSVPEDCDPRALCAFAAGQGCQAQGICVVADVACSVDNPTACGCDGTSVGGSCIYGQGYYAAPIASVGACPGPDGGSGTEGGVAPDGGAD